MYDTRREMKSENKYNQFVIMLKLNSLKFIQTLGHTDSLH